MNRFLIKYHLPPLVFALLIFAGSSFSGASLSRSFLPLFSDKLLHALEYSVFGFLLARSMRHMRFRPVRKHAVLTAIVLALLYAISDEIHQSFVPGRSVELADLLADLAGATLGATAYLGLRLWIWRRKGHAHIPVIVSKREKSDLS